MNSDRRPPTAEEYVSYRTRFNNWGRWGKDDQFGTLNFISDAARRSAATLVREGRTVSCGRALATTPGPQNRRPAQHLMQQINELVAQDYIGLYCHGFVDSHMDALCHIFTTDQELYGGRPKSEVTVQGARSCSIDQWQDGVFTRGVLYDIPRLRKADYVALESPVQGWELEEAAAAQHVVPQTGDAALVHFGRDRYFKANPQAQNTQGQKPGLNPSVLEFLHGHSAAVLCSEFDEAPDERLVELDEKYRSMVLHGYPSRAPVHAIAIPYMGMALVWNANLDRLSRICAELGRWEFLFVVSPLIVEGGTGSPVNPMAVL